MNRTYLADIIPIAGRYRLPLTRDSLLLLMVSVNMFMLGLETYLAHSISGTIVFREWIPVLYGPVAGVILLVAGLIAFRRRMLANLLGTAALTGSIVVGMLGTYFHWVRTILPNAALNERVSIPLFVWGVPMLAPFMFILIGVLGMSAAWQEDPPGSGILVLPGGARLRMPYSKTRAYFWVVAIGTLFTVISAVLDHARSGMENPWTWLPLAIGIFAFFVSLAMGFFHHLHRDDVFGYLLAMGLMVLVGVIGLILHVSFDLQRGQLVGERLIRAAPLLAPLLFGNMGGIGLLVLIGEHDPEVGE